jgi:hypothetical protein
MALKQSFARRYALGSSAGKEGRVSGVYGADV